MLHLTMLVLPVEEVPYTNNGGVPVVPVAVISRLICDSLPGQRLDNTDKLIGVPETRLFLLRCIRREQLRKHRLNLSAVFGSNNNKSTDSCWALLAVAHHLQRHCRLPCKRVVLTGFSGSHILGMCGDNILIDLTAGEKGPSSSGQWKGKRRCNHTAETIDLSSTAIPGTDAVDMQRPLQADEAGPSTHEHPAEVEEQHAAVGSEEEATNRRKGKRKRTWAADRAKQVEGEKQLVKAQKAEAKAQKAEAKAMRDEAKAAGKKRVNQFGKIVRYATRASEKTKERMARAMPGKCASFFNSEDRCSVLAPQVCLL